MRLDIRLHSSPHLDTREEFAQFLRHIADTIERYPVDLNVTLSDANNVRVGSLQFTGAPAARLH